MSVPAIYDIFIIGGGITGVGIARDAAGRGFSVGLAEKGDLGEGASSRGVKLLQGGLRDLEQRRLGPVREAIEERDRLLRLAPHIVRPLRCVLPQDRENGRPGWLLRLGLEIYGSLSKRSPLPAPSALKLAAVPEGRPLKSAFGRGFAFSECRVDDARLVVLNARSAADHGAAILTRTACVAARREEGLWRISLRDSLSEKTWDVKARALVDAAGPWTDAVLTEVLDRPARPRFRLVRGSHVVVPALYDGDQAYVLQHKDGRLVFVIPFEGRFSLVGSTEAPHEGAPDDTRPTADEIASLCDAVNRVFRRSVSAADVRHAAAGLWPLAEDKRPQAGLHGDTLEVEGERVEAPLLTVCGGDLIGYRRRAEAVLAKLKTWFPNLRPPWTATAPLPGGDIPEADFARFLRGFRQRRPWLPPDLSLRYARSYGTRADALLEGARSLDDLGRNFGAGLTEREVYWLMQHEWAATAEDVLWRRSKLGLHMAPEQRQAFAVWMLRAEVPQMA